jgi:hypothetical protein
MPNACRSLALLHYTSPEPGLKACLTISREKILTAEDAEGAETKTEGKRERIGDGGLIASLVFSAFFSASSAVRNDMERRFSPQRTQRAQRERPRESGSGLEMEG